MSVMMGTPNVSFTFFSTLRQRHQQRAEAMETASAASFAYLAGCLPT